jgi:diguanylate cyclase (GGDEF)-like protein
VAEKVDARFEMIRELAELLASDSRLTQALQHPELLPDTNAHLQDVAASLQLHRVLLLNAHGVCIASNEADSRKNLIGVSLADREYFFQAQRGKLWSQFVVGRVSAVPGFHFSAPVRQGKAILGVVALKIDVQTLSQHISLPSGFILDSLGVVVLSDNPDNLLHAVPKAPALGLSATELVARYQRSALPTLPMGPKDVAGQEVYAYGDDNAPSLRHVVTAAKNGLTVYGFSSLGEVLAEAEQRFRQHVLSTFFSVYLALVILSGALVYVVRDAHLRRGLQRLNAELQEQAHRDPLTGCYNRRLFDDLLRGEFLRSTRTRLPFALVFFDLDSFKGINDTYGHGVGDDMLRHVAGILRRELREMDVLSRYGGDEFAILLPAATEEQAVEAMLRLVILVENTPLQTEDGPLEQRISAGTVAFDAQTSEGQMLEQADKALYAAKMLGRNRVVGYSSLQA